MFIEPHRWAGPISADGMLPESTWI